MGWAPGGGKITVYCYVLRKNELVGPSIRRKLIQLFIKVVVLGALEKASKPECFE